MTQITVIKRDHNGQDVLSYTGEIISRNATSVCLRAIFSIEEVVRDYVTLRRGDIFTEWFYTDRWYNIFRVDDARTGDLKGWYCNLTRPAILDAQQVASDDLALDIFVQPDGDLLLLDEDEYDELSLSAAEMSAVRAAIADIRHMVATRSAMFADIRPHHLDE